MQIQGVNNLDASINILQGIKGDVSNGQLSSLTELFSTNIWNTSENAGTTIERQIADMQALLDEIEAKIEELYDQQKAENAKMDSLINSLNNESYQATKQADKNLKEQQDLVSAATDEAYNKYMKGEIEKEEIPMYIASAMKKSNSSSGAALESHLAKMDSWGQSITSLSNKIAGILDDVNEYKAQYQTTQTSMDLLAKLKAKIPEHKTRDDIQSTIANPVYTPSQEALGDKLIDAYKVSNNGTWADGDESTTLLSQALQGSGTVDEARKAELDAMTPEDKAAAVEEADTSKYSALELLYLSGMNDFEAANAIGNIFRGAGIGYNEENGNLIVPLGHGGIKDIYNNLISQYTTLWGGGIERGSETDEGNGGGADPIGWRNGDTNFMFAVDRDGDNIFDGAEEFLGAENGWNEVVAADANGDGILTAQEAAAAGFRVVDVNQALTGGGTYGFNGVAESGFESLDLNSYKAVSDVKSTNLNGNTRVGTFDVTVNGEVLDGVQTINSEEYNEMFYGHMEGEAYSFGLDPDEVASALAEAAKKEDYTAADQAALAAKVEDVEDAIDADKTTLNNLDQAYKEVTASATENRGQGLNRVEDEDEETATNTTDNTNTTTTTTTTTTAEDDPYIPEL